MQTSVLIPRIVPAQVQSPALAFVKPHGVHLGPPLQPVQVPLNDIPSLWCIDNPTQLGVICKLADGALNPSVYVVDKNVKQYQSQHGPLRDTTCHCSPSGLQAIEYHPLDATIQPIPYPLNSPPIKSEKLINFKMSSVKRLVYAVIHFLREQSQMDTFTPDEQESLEACAGKAKNPGAMWQWDAEMDSSRAHMPLFPGNNHMKEENYGAAVDCYTRAIKLDPNNAVYYCNRAAALSKLNNYSEAIKDCERAIAIDPKYSKAYGRMGLALTSVNKYEEAVTSYQKALDLDPENDSYKSNLKIAEEKLRDVSSPTGSGLSFDMASLINNPAFISMAASLMQNPQVQQLMSGMMSNAIGGPAAGVGGLSDLSSLIHAYNCYGDGSVITSVIQDIKV
ncbi:small glutamine-rich tetratricopeptide repeat-containing protein beta [Limosa lapponica baueri]|uniref:Small glutamine-rich tetratricopeptide repeat-containing protein beta n=1 Tax=Limosa lapponica baueri TaxID=1758121 RepID=A0A2I0U1R2_LIMLA|nr:small glutamine-rich tetratricopeptide repeat-containing protein beta [Limosa lapponica baueri]